MTWDTTAYEVCLCALGTVEASMNYGAVNQNDVLSVGILQWYAGRAANVLNIMRTTNSADWVGVPDRLTDALEANDSTSSFWESYYPNADEINALNTVMNTAANIAIQDTQAYSDIDGYCALGANLGLNRDTNTETTAFYCNIYNRDPSSANRIIGNCGPTSNLSRILSYTLNDSVESNYRNRYNTAYQIINDQTTAGVGTPPGTITNPNPGNGAGGGNGTPLQGNASYITERGSQLHLQNKDGTTLIFQRVASGGAQTWLSSQDVNIGGGNPPPNGGGTPPSGAIEAIIAWEASVEGQFAYSEGAGRLDPVTSGQTDCSGLQYYAFLTYGDIDIGTWTGTQCKNGTLITTDPTAVVTNIKPGDLIFFRWSSSSPYTYDHVELYIGNGQTQSQGGPGAGPTIDSLQSEIDAAINGVEDWNGPGTGRTPGSIMVRRYIT